MASSSVYTPTIALSPGRLYALSHPYAVDGRVSWHDPAARGWAAMHCYLYLEEDGALLVDTGLTIHREPLLAQLAELVGGRSLSIFCLRLGEFDSMCNILAIGERFEVVGFYGLLGAGHRWGDFLPESLAALTARDDRAFASMQNHPLGRGGTVRLAADGSRDLDAFFAPLHLLASYWVWDPVTRVMLTNDVFTHLLAPGPEGPWLLDDDQDGVTEDDLRSHLLGTRFWWLEGARVDGMRAQLASAFERYPIEALAPAYGRIVRGRPAVERHYAMLDRVLADLGSGRG